MEPSCSGGFASPQVWGMLSSVINWAGVAPCVQSPLESEQWIVPERFFSVFTGGADEMEHEHHLLICGSQTHPLLSRSCARWTLGPKAESPKGCSQQELMLISVPFSTGRKRNGKKKTLLWLQRLRDKSTSVPVSVLVQFLWESFLFCIILKYV